MLWLLVPQVDGSKLDDENGGALVVRPLDDTVFYHFA